METTNTTSGGSLLLIGDMRRSWRPFPLFCLALLIGCEQQQPLSPEQGLDEETASTLAQIASQDEDFLRDRYIVVFDNGVGDVPAMVREILKDTVATVHFLYEHTIKGFAATLPPNALADVRSHPMVDYVASDALVELFVGSWGLDRVDQRELPLNTSYAPTGNGSGVNVYVLDGGIMSAHQEFGSRTITGHPDAYDAFRDPTDPYYAEDCWGQDPAPWDLVNGHGTHVGGTVGGASYGVATQVKLISVRVFQCDGFAYEVSTASGTVSSIVAGVDWIHDNHVKPAIVNLSGGMKASVDPDAADALDDAIRASVSAGVTYIVAAGNDDSDACGYSPGRIAETITVGATTSNDYRWSSSNWGTCVDLFAPGHEIRSAGVVDSNGNMSTSATKVASGTSMAAPHVSGIAAVYVADNPTATPAQVRDRLLNTATNGVLANIGSGSPNLLAFTARVLSAAISGPSQVEEDATYTWDSVVSGGDYSYSYEWAWRYHYDDGTIGAWSVEGTEPTVTLYVTFGSPDIELRLRVDSGEQTKTDYHYVEVLTCSESCIQSVGEVTAVDGE